MNRGSRALLLRGFLVAAVFAACSASSTRDTGPDPFNDPFFREGMGGSSLDEVTDRPAPSVGWLSNDKLYDTPPASESDMIRRERRAAGAGEVVEAEGRDELATAGDSSDDESADASVAPGHGREKTFGEKAEEATLATMSVLIGAGMAALPYLLGT